MTLQSIVNQFINIAKKQPNINYVGEGDIYVLNSQPNIDYSVFFVTQQEHSQSENTITYNLYLYYVDRLTESENNTLSIQSTGLMVLGNIINIFNNEIDDAVIDYDVRYTTFTHRFADACAGAFATLQITAPNGLGICEF